MTRVLGVAAILIALYAGLVGTFWQNSPASEPAERSLERLGNNIKDVTNLQGRYGVITLGAAPRATSALQGRRSPSRPTRRPFKNSTASSVRFTRRSTAIMMCMCPVIAWSCGASPKCTTSNVIHRTLADT